MARRHPKRRAGGGRFVRLPHYLLHSDAMRDLPHSAFRVLVVLTMEFNGKNNGALGLTCDQAQTYGIRSKNTLYRGFEDLERRGLIEQTYPASRVPPRPAMYALTWLPVDETKYTKPTRTSTNAFQAWRAEKQLQAARKN